MDLGHAYLDAAMENFRNMKTTADRAMEQLNYEELHWAPDDESNSIARIVKHMSGNMVSRWTDFLTTDGEKPTRNRDEEFEGGYLSLETMNMDWEAGWKQLFDAIGALKPDQPDDLLRTVYIRSEPHSAIQAIERQVYHLSYHVGQVVYLAKQIRGTDWQTLTIPRGKSKAYLDGMVDRFRPEGDETEPR